MKRIVAVLGVSAVLATGGVVVAGSAEAVPVPVKGNRWSDQTYAQKHAPQCKTAESVKCWAYGYATPSYSVLKDGTVVFWRSG